MDRANSTKLAFLWIDDPKNNHVANYGYVCTEDNPKQVDKVRLENLPFDYTYVTNLKSHRFKPLGIKTFYGIKHASYFGVAAGQIAIELGVSDNLNEKLPIFTIVLSKIAQRIFQMYKVSVESDSWTILEGLRDTIYPSLIHQTLRLDGSESIDLNFAVENSLQKLQANNISKRGIGNGEVISAKYPKTPYFLHLINQKYPVSEHYHEENRFAGKLVGRNGTKIQGETDIEELIEYSKHNAGFLKFTLVNIDTKHSRYVPLGQEIKSVSNRQWASLPEIIDLCNYATLELGIAYITKAEKLPFAPPLPSERTKFLSYINGTVNEALLWSLSYKKEQERFTSPIAAYIRAYDRVLMRQVAMKLVDQGFDTLGFSNGTVRFLTRSTTQRAQLRSELSKKGLIPQIKYHQQ
ncbi:hypothetical protein [Vibrio harveyi]|uniref:hypothetical protein n=1 Tax=Vibrio harveyi TaxID=669 RepID=UPI0024818129|nr:hypothetical protein [Vibrio harveyi]